MDLTLARVLLFGLSLAGIPLLVFAIRLISGAFAEKILVEVPYRKKEASFLIATAGTYAIWQKAPLFKTPVGEFRPQVRSSASGQPLALRASLLRPTVNNGLTGRMCLIAAGCIIGGFVLGIVAHQLVA